MRVRECKHCKRLTLLDVLDPRLTAPEYVCDECSGRRREGEPGRVGPDSAVEIEDASADGVTIDVKVPLP